VIELNVIKKDVSELIVYNKNTKKHPDIQIDKIVNSIKEFGFNVPIIIDSKNVVIAGHGRLIALKKMGIDKVPCVLKDNLSDDQIRAYRIADNKTAESEWIEDYLKEELIDLSNNDFDLTLTGFSEDEYLQYIQEDKEIVQDEIPEVDGTDIKRGDIIMLGEHRLMCGDSTSTEDVGILMQDIKAKVLFTDMPYNAAFNGRSGDFEVIKNDDLSEKDFDIFLKNVVKIIKSLKIPEMYQCCDWHLYPKLYNHFSPKALIVWAKNVFGMGRGYRHQHELIIYNGAFDSTTESDLWNINKVSEKYIHPTQKPIELPARAIKNSSKQNDIVLDLFGGLGSTLIACEQTNRQCLMMELDPHYCEVICTRWENLTGKSRDMFNHG